MHSAVSSDTPDQLRAASARPVRQRQRQRGREERRQRPAADRADRAPIKTGELIVCDPQVICRPKPV
ncbi:MAG TPA: hypothetical protein VLF18_11640 [Tahibacter sp.]|uniref:hypothetical protein n=1 Tax=Tahibacter sp. TaxID=2056211 RepID=UPI002BD909C6|nr:hypothetical protein [Tahibacter sp.]HSX60843.1 hypothetical protein [Tahibacter sp.]